MSQPMPKHISAADVTDLLRPGMTVFVQGGPNEPATILEALEANSDASRDITYVQSIVPNMNDRDFCALHPTTRSLAYFITPGTRTSYQEGRLEFVPLQLGAVPDFLREAISIDLAIVGISPPDAQGNYGAGLNADFVDVVMERAKCIVGECNAASWTLPDNVAIEPGHIDYVVASDRPAPELALPPDTEESREIGRRVAALIDDGDCVQTGVGSIPFAVLGALGEKNDLGMHSGIIDDAAMALIRSGNINGRCKNVDPGKHVTACAMGTTAFYAELAAVDSVRFRPFSYTHSAAVLASIERFVSVNSAMEIDLGGQVNSEMIKGRQVTGTGGAVDFMRGAAASSGGRSVIALTATAAGGKLSRIVPQLGDGNMATALRTDIDYVVTEFGTARVRFLSEPERARALIEIAAPQFRDELTDQARERFGKAL